MRKLDGVSPRMYWSVSHLRAGSPQSSNRGLILTQTRTAARLGTKPRRDHEVLLKALTEGGLILALLLITAKIRKLELSQEIRGSDCAS